MEQHALVQYPSAFSYAQQNGYSKKDMADLLSIVEIVSNDNLDVSSELRLRDQIDSGSFGSIIKAEYRGKTVVLKLMEQVFPNRRSPLIQIEL